MPREGIKIPRKGGGNGKKKVVSPIKAQNADIFFNIGFLKLKYKDFIMESIIILQSLGSFFLIHPSRDGSEPRLELEVRA